MTTPKAPKGLSRSAVKIWKQIQVEYEIDDSQGLELLNEYARSWDEAQEARAYIAKHGAVVINETTGVHRANPACSILKEATSRMLRCLQQLQLDVEPAGPIGRPPGR